MRMIDFDNWECQIKDRLERIAGIIPSSNWLQAYYNHHHPNLREDDVFHEILKSDLRSVIRTSTTTMSDPWNIVEWNKEIQKSITSRCSTLLSSPKFRCMVQVEEIIDVSKTLETRYTATNNRNPTKRCLKLLLCHGGSISTTNNHHNKNNHDNLIVGMEGMPMISALEYPDYTAGVKLLITSPIQISHGICQLHSGNTVILGGEVSSLRKYQQRIHQQYQQQSHMDSTIRALINPTLNLNDNTNDDDTADSDEQPTSSTDVPPITRHQSNINTNITAPMNSMNIQNSNQNIVGVQASNQNHDINRPRLQQNQSSIQQTKLVNPYLNVSSSNKNLRQTATFQRNDRNNVIENQQSTPLYNPYSSGSNNPRTSMVSPENHQPIARTASSVERPIEILDDEDDVQQPNAAMNNQPVRSTSPKIKSNVSQITKNAFVQANQFQQEQKQKQNQIANPYAQQRKPRNITPKVYNPYSSTKLSSSTSSSIAKSDLIPKNHVSSIIKTSNYSNQQQVKANISPSKNTYQNYRNQNSNQQPQTPMVIENNHHEDNINTGQGMQSKIIVQPNIAMSGASSMYKSMGFVEFRNMLSQLLKQPNYSEIASKEQTYVVPCRTKGNPLDFNFEKSKRERKSKLSSGSKKEKWKYFMIVKIAGPNLPDGFITCKISHDILMPFFKHTPSEVRSMQRIDNDKAGNYLKEKGLEALNELGKLHSYHLKLNAIEKPTASGDKRGLIVNGYDPVVLMVPHLDGTVERDP